MELDRINLNGVSAEELPALKTGILALAGAVPCKYCERTGQPLMSCCAAHPDDLVCADVAGCRDCLLAQLASR